MSRDEELSGAAEIGVLSLMSVESEMEMETVMQPERQVDSD